MFLFKLGNVNIYLSDENFTHQFYVEMNLFIKEPSFYRNEW